MAKGSASKLSRIRRCKRLVWYRDIKKLRRKIPSIAPSRGKVLHAALEEYYKGNDWTKPIETMQIDMSNVFDEEREEWARVQGDMYRIMRGYIRTYKERDANIKVLATELEFEVDLGNGHTYGGIIDLIYEDETGVWVRDYKTVKQIPDPEDLYMDVQIFMYFYAAKELGYNPVGVEFDHLRTKVPTQPRLLKNGTLSKDKSIDCDVVTYFEAVKSHGLNPQDYADMVEPLKKKVFYKRTRIPVKKVTLDIMRGEAMATLGEYEQLQIAAEQLGDRAYYLFPRNMMRQRCSWDCDYFKLCFSELAGMDTSGLIDEEYEMIKEDEERGDEKTD